MDEVAPETLLLSLPFLFRDEYEMDFIIEKYEPLLAGYARERGIEILGLFPIGPAQIFSTVPSSGLDELRDKKVMCLEKSKIFEEFFHTFGWKSPICLPFSKVEAALSSGEVEDVIRSGERLNQGDKWESQLGNLRVIWLKVGSYALVVTVIKTKGR